MVFMIKLSSKISRSRFSLHLLGQWWIHTLNIAFRKGSPNLVAEINHLERILGLAARLITGFRHVHCNGWVYIPWTGNEFKQSHSLCKHVFSSFRSSWLMGISSQGTFRPGREDVPFQWGPFCVIEASVMVSPVNKEEKSGTSLGRNFSSSLCTKPFWLTSNYHVEICVIKLGVA